MRVSFFCPPTIYYMPNGMVKYIDLGGKFELPPTYLKSYIKTTEQKERNVERNVEQKVSLKVKTDKNEVIDKLLYLGLLNGKAHGTWDDWRNVALCMRWITTFEHFNEFSKLNTSKYDKKRNDWFME